MNDLKKIEPTKLTGAERFTSRSQALKMTVRDFWAWSASDLIENTTRGILAEFIVAHAVGAETTGVRDGWAAVDLTLNDGTKVEVKSSSYIQSWQQKTLSRITYGIAPTRCWDPVAGEYTGKIRRQADLYVFALLAPRLGYDIDPLNLDQWEFYVLSTTELDRRMERKRSISLSRLRTFAKPVSHSELAGAISHARRNAA